MLRSRALVVVGGSIAIAGIAIAAVRTIDAPATVDQRARRGDAARVTDTVPPPTTPYRVPVADQARATWGDSHASYPATDLFAGCGATLVSPVTGTVVHVRRIDSWRPEVDDPATRGGRSVAIVGLDGVRYYLAHFDEIADTVSVGYAVVAGEPLGTMGDTGRTSACHLHFGISPPCPNEEWWVRRGVVWPAPYLDDWRRGRPSSPAAEIAEWSADDPQACRNRP